MRLHSIAAAALVCLGSSVSWADSATLAPSADTTLLESNPTFNLGGTPTLVAGATANGARGRALLQFDIAKALPANATIQSAVLNLTVTRAPLAGGAASTFVLHRVLVPWSEGNKTGNTGTAADPNEATWNARVSPDTLWSRPGAAAPADFSADTSSQILINALGAYVFPSTPALVSDLQLWLANTNQNFGWILISQSEDTVQSARRFGSREDPANAPTLTIQFTLPSPTLLRISKVNLLDSKIALQWDNGRAPFQIQKRASWSQPWTNIGQPLNTNAAALPIDSAIGFLRVAGSQP